MAETTIKKEIKYVVYAPFTLGRKSYKAGDTFNPGDMERDYKFEEFRNMDRTTASASGLAFVEILPPLTPKGDPFAKRHILPLKEA